MTELDRGSALAAGEAPRPGEVWLVGAGPGDTSLLIWGDIVHFPSIQSARPEASVAFDVDPEQARRTRESVLRQAASEQWLIAGMHLGLPGFARVVETPSGYLLQSV